MIRPPCRWCWVQGAGTGPCFLSRPQLLLLALQKWQLVVLFCFVFWCFLSCCPLLAPTAHFFWSLVVAFYSVAWGGCIQIQTQPQRVPGRRLVSRVWVMVTTSVCFFFQVISRLSNKSTVSQVWLFAKEQNIYLKFVGFPTNLFPPWRFFVFTFDFP